MLSPGRRAAATRAWREGRPGAWGALLWPAALAYRGGLALHRATYALGLRRPVRLACPVVAVGNLVVGGTGKTPLVEAIARRLVEGGRRVAVLSRGYGRRGGAMRAVSDGARLLVGVDEAGDEPLLLARRLPGVPVVVGRDRGRAGAWALARFGADVLVLDDGFQHRRLVKDVEVVCLDADRPWGAGGLIPRGTLREPPAALARAHLIVLTGAEAAADIRTVTADVRRWAPAAPIVPATYEVEGIERLGGGGRAPLEALREQALLAFAGIAAPERFAATLAGAGVRPLAFVAFPDHHAYRAADVRALLERARAVGARALVTTEKDAVRLVAPPGLPTWAVGVRLRLGGDPCPWWAALDARLAGAAR